MRGFCAVLLLCGCSTVTHEWTREGSTTADQDRDFAECSEPHKTTIGLFGVAGALGSNSAITECMRKKGWQEPKR